MRESYKGITINTTKKTHQKVFELINSDKNATIVDIPSGSGAFVLRLKDAGYQNIIAVDIENLLQFDHRNFILGDMTKTLQITDNQVDTVVCIDGIEHISQQFNFAGEINRILKTGGEFIISTPNISSLRSRWKWLFTGHHHKCNSPLDENNPTPLHHIGMISFPEMQYLLHTKGFKISQIATNRIKPVSWIFALLVPFVFLTTFWVYSKTGKKQKTTAINRNILKKMFSQQVLFGETLIVRAIKIENRE